MCSVFNYGVIFTSDLLRLSPA